MPGREKDLQLGDGRRVSLWDGGDPQGRAVLFFHGCPDSRRAAIPGHDAALGAQVRLIAVSRPGYSDSDLPRGAGPFSGREHLEVADDTIEVARLLSLDDFAVLGMSVGGPYALATAARHPGHVRAVGVVEAPAEVPRLHPLTHRDDLDEAGRAFFQSLATTPPSEAAEAMRPEFEAYVAGIDPHDDDDSALATRWLETLPPEDAALVGERGAAEIARVARESLAHGEGYLRDAAVSFRSWPFSSGDVRCPVFAWYGDGDDTYSPRNGRWYADALGANLVMRSGASHLGTLLEHWSEILSTLADQ